MIVNDTVTIDGKDYRLGLSLRVHVIYERITGKPVDGHHCPAVLHTRCV